jgi:hypothetical protein
MTLILLLSLLGLFEVINDLLNLESQLADSSTYDADEIFSPLDGRAHLELRTGYSVWDCRVVVIEEDTVQINMTTIKGVVF